MQFPHVKICLLGAGGVGKTAILQRYLFDQFLEEYDPTVEESFSEIVRLTSPRRDFDVVKMNLLDTSGQYDLYTHWIDEWIMEADGVLLVFSLTSSSSLSEANHLFTKVRSIKDDIPITVIGNKNDLQSTVNEELLKMCTQQWSLPIFHASAKTGENIDSSVEHLINAVFKSPEKQENDKYPVLKIWKAIREGFKCWPYEICDLILLMLFEDIHFTRMKGFSREDRMALQAVRARHSLNLDATSIEHNPNMVSCIIS